jgi:hypothetical protein
MSRPKKSSHPVPSGGEILLYQTEDGGTRIQCRFDGATIWLSQIEMAELFQTTVANVNIHLKAIYAEGELSESATIKPYLIVRSEGARQVSREVLHYRLEAILAVGFRVRSQRGTQFRQWAITRLEEYLRKGFTMDDERLKNPPGPGVPDYFDELLERIRDIRSSEKRVYLQLRNILALAADYDPSDDETLAFYQTVQNKLHYAVTGKTAPELIAARADAAEPNMGLTSWKGAIVRKADVTIAKNFLSSEEITALNRIVTMFLDFAQDQAERRRQVFLNDWKQKLDQFLEFNERKVLPGSGRISREKADQHALGQYQLFEDRRRKNLENEAEEALKQLSETAKKLPSRKKSEA